MVKARVLDVDVEKERISLGIKQLAGDPLAGDVYRKGQTVTVTVTEITSGGIEVKFGDDAAPMTAFIRKSDLSRDRSEQRPERFAVGDRLDAQVTNIDKAARRVSLSVKALEMAEDKEAIEKFGSSDSGASLGDILGAALREKASRRSRGLARAIVVYGAIAFSYARGSARTLASRCRGRATLWASGLEFSMDRLSGGESVMIKSELIAALAAENPHLTQRDVERVVSVILESMITPSSWRARRVARFRSLLGAEPSGPAWPQPAHRRSRQGQGQARAFLQERQGAARSPQRRLAFARVLIQKRIPTFHNALSDDTRQDLRPVDRADRGAALRRRELPGLQFLRRQPAPHRIRRRLRGWPRPARGRAAIVAVTVDPDDALLERLARVCTRLHPAARARDASARRRDRAATGWGSSRPCPVATADDLAAARDFRAWPTT